jgi:putative lipoic acid-binding regulatory protein
MSEPTPPRVEFPCDYPIKVVGDGAADFREVVVDIIRVHAPDLDEAGVSVRESRNGRFLSVNVVIRATGEAQLQAIFTSLKQTGRVQMVL